GAVGGRQALDDGNPEVAEPAQSPPLRPPMKTREPPHQRGPAGNVGRKRHPWRRFIARGRCPPREGPAGGASPPRPPAPRLAPPRCRGVPTSRTSHISR